MASTAAAAAAGRSVGGQLMRLLLRQEHLIRCCSGGQPLRRNAFRLNGVEESPDLLHSDHKLKYINESIETAAGR